MRTVLKLFAVFAACIFVGLVTSSYWVNRVRFNRTEAAITNQSTNDRMRQIGFEVGEKQIEPDLVATSSTVVAGDNLTLGTQTVPGDDLSFGKMKFKTNWSNVGFETIASAIETYYWAMRETNFDEWLQCQSQLEKAAWRQLAIGRVNVLAANLAASLQSVDFYQIESATKFDGNKYLVVIKHKLNGRTRDAAERLSLSNGKDGWKITGEEGVLQYRHHPADISKFDALIQTGRIVSAAPGELKN